ncbi:DEAD/DEAH box helicase [Allofrancisella guangzhouensis]|uniref:ATP-dependent RNA helicase DeaD n=1 Tax=Allofrancisella guangzhouensis TaxID=594679 RepID=A0A0A8E9X2_9GAMM|nr:DEAD/DEAH box helicase [Allofrancisella guangzhouensis]AJC48961.1 RNA helicase [Allofrancisella guangzhouensis]MBK2027073.1 DEAD/DEAH box helicase [Allofrancisella guangzhouensis]MBK2044204.1 DEAD/DEAH box helicase [Allofrancisella guangzhouensis]MBK2045689.1 DEAD/DEAH box helicase [Allofrancisella guangzhouensis]
MNSETKKDFSSLGLDQNIVDTVINLGYENPTPIQQYAIPYILSGRDVLGQAQTGTGKTAAFALPLINNLDLNDKSRSPQILVLAPTRELAIQVAEQFEAFAKSVTSLSVACIYGGQEYGSQIRALKNGVQVVVGTTGRVMDHIEKGTLKLDNLRALVLDEADEMLRMGFIDDVRWVLSHISDDCQRLLFSATIPEDIADIIKEYLRNPCKIQVKAKTKTANTITQKFIVVKGFRKIDALDRLLEIEETDGVVIFVKTKTSTIEVADNLKALGYKVAAINGDMQQSQREYIVEQFKSARSNILVATDVVARGIDLERISHVINYDMPNDEDTYVHRIGRTGRAGREGVSISLVTLKEMRFLRSLERFTNSKLEEVFMPSAKELADSRINDFKNRITSALEKNKSLDKYKEIIIEIRDQLELDSEDLLAVLTLLAQDKKGFFPREIQAKEEKRAPVKRDERTSRPSDRFNDRDRNNNSRFDKKRPKRVDIDLTTYRIDVGRENDVQPRNIVGAIANEGGIDSKHICNISIEKDYTLVDLPANLSAKVINHLKKVWVAGKKLNLTEHR